MRYPMGALGRGCRGGRWLLSRQPGPCDGRLAQRESASFTPRRSLFRSQYRPPQVTGLYRSSNRLYSLPVQYRSAVTLAIELLANTYDCAAGLCLMNLAKALIGDCGLTYRQ